MLSIQQINNMLTDYKTPDNCEQLTMLATYINDFDKPDELLYDIIGMLMKNIPIDIIQKNIEDCKFGLDSEWFESQQKQQENQDDLLCNPPEIKEGDMPCPKCGTLKTLFIDKQTRSADEGSTLFIFCLDEKCKKVTKY